jgi:hypothetical protein
MYKYAIRLGIFYVLVGNAAYGSFVSYFILFSLFYLFRCYSSLVFRPFYFPPAASSLERFKLLHVRVPISLTRVCALCKSQRIKPKAQSTASEPRPTRDFPSNSCFEKTQRYKGCFIVASWYQLMFSSSIITVLFHLVPLLDASYSSSRVVHLLACLPACLLSFRAPCY